MKFNPQLKKQIEKFRDYVMIVEGKKDTNALRLLGFEKVYMIHLPGIPLRERAEHIMLQLTKKEKICLLTDFDKKGKQLYHKLKPIFQELGANLDSTFRGLLIKVNISHIEGLSHFMEKIDKI